MSRRNNRRRSQTDTAPNWLLRTLVIAFILAASITAVLVFRAVRDITTGNIGTGINGPVLQTSTPNAEGLILPPGGATALPELFHNEPVVQLTEWDGASRVNLLVLGLDFRDWIAGEGPPRTDSMILLTLDPASRSAGILSIPRDLWVEIPGFGHAKINTAYQLGEAAQLPGRGPGLAVATVEQFLGVDINYYAQVDFDAFVRFIDYIGGVKIDVEEYISLPLVGKELPERLEPGRYTLTGEIALAYARNRSTAGGDFDRAQRQQQLLFAIRRQLLRRDVQAIIFANGADIYLDLSSGIQTNLKFEEILELGFLAIQIEPENIKTGSISVPDHVTLGTSPDGLSILKPITQNIRILRDEIFSVTGIGPIAGGDPRELALAEAATVAVFNGTATTGLAGQTQEYLVGLGINVVQVDNANFEVNTLIIDYTGKPYTLQYLVDLMGIQKSRIFSSFDPDRQVDIEIILGADWVLP